MFELAGHFDISIGLTVMLMAELQAGQVGRDRTSFLIFPTPRSPRSSTTTPSRWWRARSLSRCPTCSPRRSRRRSRGAVDAPDTVGPGYYALMRLDEFVPIRVVEAVVHGLDLTDAVGRAPIATPEGVR